jgi:hypothetical protein
MRGPRSHASLVSGLARKTSTPESPSSERVHAITNLGNNQGVASDAAGGPAGSDGSAIAPPMVCKSTQRACERRYWYVTRRYHSPASPPWDHPPSSASTWLRMHMSSVSATARSAAPAGDRTRGTNRSKGVSISSGVERERKRGGSGEREDLEGGGGGGGGGGGQLESHYRGATHGAPTPHTGKHPHSHTADATLGGRTPPPRTSHPT